jgi:NitT/TauT family transport system substrate-binding protein
MSPSPFRRPRGRAGKLLTALGAAALLLAASGCSALGGSDAPPEGGAATEGGAVEKADLNVGVLPIVDVAAIQRAKSEGYFEAEGLNVNLVAVESGAVALPQVINGELDLTWTNWTNVILAEQQGIAHLHSLKSATYQAASNSFLMLVKPDSNIRTAQDMVGKKLAINGQGSITELVARAALQAGGIDPASVSYVTIPFPQMQQALDTGQVDAITVLEPFLTQAETGGAVTLLDAASGVTAEIPIAGVTTRADFVNENPKTIAAFERAMTKAQAEMADRSIVEQTLPTYTKITADNAPLLNLGTWPTTIEPTNLQRVADLMTQFGMLPAPFDTKVLLEDGQG